MKKIFTTAALSLLLAGCFGSGVTTENATPEEQTAPAENQAAAILTEDAFVTTSAEILCLPTNNPEATPAEIETKAKAILAKSNVTEEDFNAYQQNVSADDKEKMRVSYAIIGKMSDFCKIVTPGGEAAPAESTPAEAPAEPAITPEEALNAATPATPAA